MQGMTLSASEERAQSGSERGGCLGGMIAVVAAVTVKLVALRMEILRGARETSLTFVPTRPGPYGDAVRVIYQGGSVARPAILESGARVRIVPAATVAQTTH